MPKLLLHAGLHKTGTTAIQTFAHKNRKALRGQGLIYPDYSTLLNKTYEAHHDLAHTLAGQAKRLHPDQAPMLIKKWRYQAEGNGGKLFVSSESICRHVDTRIKGSWVDKRKAYLKKLAEVFWGFDITVVVVLRRQDNYVKSLFQEKVMKNSALGKKQFPEFCKHFINNMEQKSFFPTLRMFEDCFPDIKVLLYEDLLSEPGLCQNFFSQLGIDTQQMSDVGVVRRSLDPRQTVLKIFLNKGIVTPRQNTLVLSWIHSSAVQDLLNKHFGHDKFDLWENLKTRKDFFNLFQKENEEIRKKYFPNKSVLFPPVLEEQASTISPLSDEFKAEIALLQLPCIHTTSKKLFLNYKSTISWIINRYIRRSA